MITPAIKFEQNKLFIIDQTLIPSKFEYTTLSSAEETCDAIRELKVRGAPAIGIVAAYAMFIEAQRNHTIERKQFQKRMDQTFNLLLKSRPTAINLKWALMRIKNIYDSYPDQSVQNIVKHIRSEAVDIHKEDYDACKKIAKNGLKILPNPCNILTHCNTGSLATGGWGTALGIIYAAAEKKYKIHVYVDETRPLGQGARLTFWELMQNKIPCTLITDSTAASLMKDGKVDVVLFGADRIAKNGDLANKIGTYGLSVLAKAHNIPCYAAAPTSTIDMSIKSGNDIPIEQRNKAEILKIYDYNNSQYNKSNVYNPAFDITPAEILSGIITEFGIFHYPFEDKITKTFR
jgi:methylthioribose-1-phosphate isomerase